MATLGIALREHFPQYYNYFSTRSFKYGKQRMANHNRLLGRVKGVDGIKTGYTRASGFNLVTSVARRQPPHRGRRDGRPDGRARDNQMAELIKKYLPKASSRDGGDLIAKVGGRAGRRPSPWRNRPQPRRAKPGEQKARSPRA